MSQFFAEGSAAGNPRLHLTTSNDTNVAMGGPTNETIFHSNMPYVLITEDYSVAANAGDNGYYYGAIPDPIINYMSSNPNRVIITELIYSLNGSEYSKMIYGGSVSSGAFGYQDRIIINQGPNQPVLISIGASFASQLTASADIVCDFGYYTQGSNMSIADNIFYGTGRKYGFQGSASGFGNLGLWGARTWKCYDNIDSSTANPSGVVNTPFPASELIAPSGLQRGYNRFYVKASLPLVSVIDPQDNLNGLNNQLQYEYKGNQNGTDGSGQSRSYVCAPLSNLSGNNYGFTMNNGYPFIPLRVRWLVTNLDFNGGGYNVNNIFTGNDILLSPTSFTIKGVNVMTTGIKFINLVAPGLSVNRPDMEVIAANTYTNTYNPGSVVGQHPWAAGYNTGVGVLGGEGSGWNGAGFSIYKFQPSASWQVNTTVPSIGNQWGDVWSPSQNPLKVFTNNVATVNLTSGQGSPTNGQAIGLTTINLDLNTSRGGAVLVTMRFNDNYWLSASGPGGFNPMDAQFGGQNSRISMNTPSPPVVHWQHMILSLPIGAAVPFYTVRCGVYSRANGTASPPAGVAWGYQTFRLCAFTYYIRNNGNGTADIVVGMDGQTGATAATQGKTQIPNITLTVQKLA